MSRRHEQRVDGSRLSPGQRTAYDFIQGGSAGKLVVNQQKPERAGDQTTADRPTEI